MNDHHTPDDLPGHLDEVGDALERPPRPDARIDALLRATPPVSGLPGASPVAVPLSSFDPPASTRRIAWVAVAAAVALLAGIGVAMVAVADDDPLPFAAAGGIDDQDEAPADTDETRAADDDVVPAANDPTVDTGRDWLECLADQFESMFAGGFSGHDGERLGLSAVEECGEPPSFDGDGWYPFGEMSDLGEWSDFEMLPDLGELPSFEELCSTESTETSVELECVWPSCDDGAADCPFPLECAGEPDGVPGSCADLDLDLDFGFELDLDAEGFGFRMPFDREGQFFFDPGALLDPEALLELFPDFEGSLEVAGATDA
jgi:hypothetical protein